MDELPRVALIAGPTASGKSGLAVALAKSLEAKADRAVVINADASQVYRDLEILSARPTVEEMEDVPHRLFGHVDGADEYNAARWAEEAKREISAAHDEGAIPILVGGTGMYIRTLLNGIAPVPEIDPEVRERVRGLGVADAYAELQSADPHAAARLKPADTTRVARALEVVLATGTPIGEWQRQTRGGIADGIALTAQILLPPRDWLAERCDRRFEEMVVERRAATEVARLLARALPLSAPVMRAIGVPDLAVMLDGKITESEAISRGQLATRQYAKRQYTWFRNQPPPAWPRMTESLNSANISKFATLLRDRVLTR
ncbi:tRNA (adenosine(37)-N6)-dimethylallyltransferase MiaA [Pseudonocardia sp. TMWB2A]|uniref:tRNA (adenosine(37)-N6)-dimethylallyltransferase MiaA n=1 Tax=Pseudonocardia sp. TMWB2A TaxID=687430 RepID=UPI00307EA896